MAGKTWRAEAMLPQPPQDVVFHAVVEGDDGNVRWRQRFPQLARIGRFIADGQLEARALLVLFIPTKRRFVGDFLDVIHAHENKFLGAFDGFRLRNILRGNETVHRAAHPQFFGQGARINALDARDPFFSR